MICKGYYKGYSGPWPKVMAPGTRLTSLEVELNVVGGVKELVVPEDGRLASAHPDLAPLLLDESDDLLRDGGPDKADILIFLAGIDIQVADFLPLHVPAIHPGNPIVVVLDEGDGLALGGEVISNGYDSNLREVAVPSSPEDVALED